MLGVGTEVPALPVAVACEQVESFVEGLRLLPDREGQLQHEHGQQPKN